MASALVNNPGVPAADGFLDFSTGSSTMTTFSWLSPSRVSSMGGRERDSWDNKQQQSGKKVAAAAAEKKKACVNAISSSSSGTAVSSFVAEDVEMDEFEFRLGDPVGGMLSADELFADGKLVPLQLAAAATTTLPAAVNNIPETVVTEAPESVGSSALLGDPPPPPSVLISSPRAPKCSSRWKELLRFKKAAQNAKLEQVQKAAAASAPVALGPTTQAGSGQQQHSCNQHPVSGNYNSSNNLRSLRHFLHRNNPNKLFSSSGDGGGNGSLTLPLLRRDMDLSSSSSSSLDSISIPARLSLSSSSSSATDHDDLPRLSLDFDRPASRNNQPPRLWLSKSRIGGGSAAATDPLVRLGRSPGRRATEAVPPPRCASVDSPRMNSSGKVVFQNLGRSSSSPSSIGGGGGSNGARNNKCGRAGVDRCYSTNVRITPVLNVPVCSLKSGSVFGLGLFSPQKKTTTDRDRGDHHHGAGGGSRSSRGGPSSNRSERVQ